MGVKVAEKMGRGAGELISTLALDRLRNRVQEFEISLNGEEMLENFSEVPFIIACNHLEPTDPKAKQLQLPPDAFVLESIIEQAIGKRPRVVAKSDDGNMKNNRARDGFTQGVIEGMGFIPIRTNPDAVTQRGFLEGVSSAVDNNDPIIIFPEGHWKPDFNPEEELMPGTGHISKKHEIPVIPVYIQGADGWQEGQEVSVSFGDPIFPTGLSKGEITGQIHSAISSLQAAAKE